MGIRGGRNIEPAAAVTRLLGRVTGPVIEREHREPD